MRFLAIQRIAGILVILSSLTMIPPAIVSLWYQDGSMPAFIKGLFIVLGLGLLIWWPARNVHQELRLRDGFLVVVIAWAVVAAAAVRLACQYYVCWTEGLFQQGSRSLLAFDHLDLPLIRSYLQALAAVGLVV